jgi:hypothetical protein
MGKKDIVWQDTAYVLALFGKTLMNVVSGQLWTVDQVKLSGPSRRQQISQARVLISHYSYLFLFEQNMR